MVRFQSAIRALAAFARPLRRCTFETMDAFEFLARVEDLDGHGVYCDPPFPGAGRRYLHNAGQTDGEERAWHTRLRDALSRFTWARVVCRFYEHPLIRELYPEAAWEWRPLAGRKQSNDEAPELLLVKRPGIEQALPPAPAVKDEPDTEAEDRLPPDRHPGECWQCYCARKGFQRTNGPCRCTPEARDRRRAAATSPAPITVPEAEQQAAAKRRQAARKGAATAKARAAERKGGASAADDDEWPPCKCGERACVHLTDARLYLCRACAARRMDAEDPT